MDGKKEEIQELINGFFKELYKRDDDVAPSDLLDLIPERVDERMNSALTKPVSQEEVSDALFQIGPLKAPRTDGFPARFFQKKLGSAKRGGCQSCDKFFQEWGHARRN